MIDFLSRHLNIVAQGIGFTAMAVGIISFQFNKRKTILTIQVIMSLLWSVHFLLLGVYTGMALNIIGMLRNLIYSFRPYPGSPESGRTTISKIAGFAGWPYVFGAILLVSGIVTWNNWTSILPTVSMIIASAVMWMTDTKLIRRLNIPCSVLWFIYDIVNGSWAGTANEIFVISSITAAIIRFDLKGRKKKDAAVSCSPHAEK